jgi:UDP-N-acetylglucosamine 2-epimerase
VILGTRPEVIKLAPVVHESLQRENIAIEICSTGQHQGMLTQTLKSFELEVDHDLALMTPDQALSTFHTLAVSGIHNILVSNDFDGVLVQGDTSTALAGAIAAFHAQIPIVHVEVGLRTWDLDNPFPEEGNRVLIDSL